MESCDCHVPVEVCTGDVVTNEDGSTSVQYHLAGEFCPEETRQTVYVVDYDRELAPGIGAIQIQDYTALKSYYDTLTVCTIHDGTQPDPEPSESGGSDRPDWWPPDWWWPGESDDPTVSQDPTQSDDPEETPSAEPTPEVSPDPSASSDLGTSPSQ